MIRKALFNAFVKTVHQWLVKKENAIYANMKDIMTLISLLVVLLKASNVVMIKQRSQLKVESVKRKVLTKPS